MNNVASVELERFGWGIVMMAVRCLMWVMMRGSALGREGFVGWCFMLMWIVAFMLGWLLLTVRTISICAIVFLHSIADCHSFILISLINVVPHD